MANDNRVPAGVPTGGEFTTGERAESPDLAVEPKFVTGHVVYAQDRMYTKPFATKLIVTKVEDGKVHVEDTFGSRWPKVFDAGTGEEESGQFHMLSLHTEDEWAEENARYEQHARLRALGVSWNIGSGTEFQNADSDQLRRIAEILEEKR